MGLKYKYKYKYTKFERALEPDIFVIEITNLQFFNEWILILTGRGDRMKQAKADAAELVDSYRAEKQQDFNNTVLAAGKLVRCQIS